MENRYVHLFFVVGDIGGRIVSRGIRSGFVRRFLGGVIGRLVAGGGGSRGGRIFFTAQPARHAAGFQRIRSVLVTDECQGKSQGHEGKNIQKGIGAFLGVLFKFLCRKGSGRDGSRGGSRIQAVAIPAPGGVRGTVGAAAAGATGVVAEPRATVFRPPPSLIPPPRPAGRRGMVGAAAAGGAAGAGAPDTGGAAGGTGGWGTEGAAGAGGGVGGGGVPPGMEGGGGLLISEKIAVLKDSSRLFPSVNQEKECAKFVFHAIFFN